jgi:hypothetical protein
MFFLFCSVVEAGMDGAAASFQRDVDFGFDFFSFFTVIFARRG